MNKKLSPIGLDISGDAVRMLQLEQKTEGIAVLAADEVVFEPQAFDGDKDAEKSAVIHAVRDMLARGAFEKNRVITSLPSSDLIIKSVRLDAFDDAEIQKQLSTGALDKFGLKDETHEIRFFSAGSTKQGEQTKNEVIVFAIAKDAIKEHIEMLEAASVVPVAIDTVPSALFRALQRSLRRNADQQKANVFVDVGSKHTTMIIGKAGEIIFAKQIDIASEKINKLLASRLGIGIEEAVHLRGKLCVCDEAETVDIEPAMRQIVIDSMYSVIDELAKEISLCFRYYAVTFRGQKPEHVVFAGGDAYEKTLINALKRHLGIEIEVTQPLRGFDLSKAQFPADKRAMLCQWAVATGLALKGFEKAGSYERN